MRGLFPLAAAAACLISRADAVELMRAEGTPMTGQSGAAQPTEVGDRRRRTFGRCENNGGDCKSHQGCECKGAALVEVEASESDVRAALLQRQAAVADEEGGPQPAAGGLDKATCRKDEHYHCKEVMIEDMVAIQKPNGKLEPRGRCYNDLLKPCSSKYECEKGKHQCIWSDSPIDGGKCKESGRLCHGRWDCPREKRIGIPNEDYEDCVAPKRCEHDHTMLCENDEACGHKSKCISRCNVDAWPTRLVMQCDPTRQCYWDDPSVGQHLLFARRTSNSVDCLPLCEERAVEGKHEAKVLCMRRPFEKCYSNLTAAVCSYGVGYNGVDEDVSPSERCTCTSTRDLL